MRSRWTAALSAFALLATAPSFVSANDADVQAQMQQMQQRMQQMEDKLQATTDQLDSANKRVDEQSQLIQQSGLAETRGASNGLPGFLGQITVGGWVAASYFWNVNHPTSNSAQDMPIIDPATGAVIGAGVPVPNPNGAGMGGGNSGESGRFYPLHPDANSFSLDQVWFEIERPINEENRAGFRFDSVYGNSGALINGGGPSNRRDGIRDPSSIYIYQGYVQYLAPIGNGLTFKAGEFATPIGIEVPGTIYNQNITRSNVWTLLEPINHIGATASYAFGDSGFDAMLGIANGQFPNSPDSNQAKDALWHFGWASQKVMLGVNGIWGSEATGTGNPQNGIVNVLAKYNPTDRLSLYVNGDYDWSDQHQHPYAWGVEAGGRYGITDRTGISLRGEYVRDSDGFLGFQGWSTTQNALTNPFACSSGGIGNPTFQTTSGFGTTSCAANSVGIWGVTATVDHLLTDQLMIRAEVRWDTIEKNGNGVSNGEFFNGSHVNDGSSWGLSSNQITVGAEVVYNFNKFGGGQ